MQDRKYNFELLRIFAAIAVISIHVSSSYMEAYTSSDWLGFKYREHILVSCMFELIPRFAVPSFLMLSGTFVLEDKKNADFKYYYEKVFRKIGIPSIVICATYVFCNVWLQIIEMVRNGRDGKGVLNVLISAIIGKPFYHIWYIYMMLGVYLLIPIVIRFKKDIGENSFIKVTIIFFISAILGLWTSEHNIQWDPGLSFCYLSYCMVGYTIRKRIQKINIKAIFLFFLGFGILIFSSLLKYILIMEGLDHSIYSRYLLSPFCPVQVLASIFVFAGFAKLEFRVDVTAISKLTFEIYLFHAGIWEMLKKIVTIEMDSRIVIVLMIILVFVLSMIVSVLYKKIWKKIEEKWMLTDRICKIVGF